ncbi:hypothetical protein AMECASPLE_004701 [Ameca splendens]|uniref:Secreted protein n=1 Tax=Ameca splendens TaxID=208324 RepID=A0ABV0XC04_9TELE
MSLMVRMLQQAAQLRVFLFRSEQRERRRHDSQSVHTHTGSVHTHTGSVHTDECRSREGGREGLLNVPPAASLSLRARPRQIKKGGKEGAGDRE